MLIITLLCPFLPLRAVFVLLCILEEKITEHIYLIHKAYNLKSSFYHVNGNQYSSINYDNISLSIQLTVQYENLAGKFHTFEEFEFHHSVNIILAYPATVSVQDMDVTRNWWHQMWAYVEPRYEGHMQPNFNGEISLSRELRGNFSQ